MADMPSSSKPSSTATNTASIATNSIAKLDKSLQELVGKHLAERPPAELQRVDPKKQQALAAAHRANLQSTRS